MIFNKSMQRMVCCGNGPITYKMHDKSYSNECKWHSYNHQKLHCISLYCFIYFSSFHMFTCWFGLPELSASELRVNAACRQADIHKIKIPKYRNESINQLNCASEQDSSCYESSRPRSIKATAPPTTQIQGAVHWRAACDQHLHIPYLLLLLN